MIVLRALTTLAIASLLFASMVTSALANGAPVVINLSYLRGVANFGATGANGVAEITKVEGDVKIRARGLQRLNQDLYQAWLVNSKSGDRLALGKFNASASGDLEFSTVVELGNREFDLVVFTVEPEPDPSPNPDARIALAGFFPDKQPTPVPTLAATPRPAETPSVAAAPTAQPTPAVGQLPAARLPRTGGGPIDLPIGGGLILLGSGGALWLASHGRRFLGRRRC